MVRCRRCPAALLHSSNSRLDLFLGANRNSHIKQSSTDSNSPAHPFPAENGSLLAVAGIVIAALLGHAIWLNNGALHSTAILIVGLSTVISAIAMLCSKAPPIPITRTSLQLILITALATQFLQLHLTPPGIFISASDSDWRIFAAVLSCATFLAGGSLTSSPKVGRTCFVLTGLAFVFLAWWVLRFSPHPRIDVFEFQTQAAQAVINGSNPYGIRPQNIYGHDHFYGPGVVQDGVLQFGFPYFPLSILSVIPGYLLGDPRFAQLAFIACTGIVFALLQPGPLGRGIALLYWFSPRTLFVLEQSWTEPLLVFLASLVVISVRLFPRVSVPVFGLLLAAKQTMVWMPFLSLLLFQGTLRERMRSLLLSSLVAALITLPFLLWNPTEFWRSVVEWQFIQPFRPDSLSFAALFTNNPGGSYPTVLPFLGSAACIALAMWKSSRSPAGWAISSCLVYLVFFALNKQAFCNYYFMVIGFACLAAASATTLKRATNQYAQNLQTI